MEEFKTEGQGNVENHSEVLVVEKLQRSPWASMLGPKDINQNSRYNLIKDADLEPVVEKMTDALKALGAELAPSMLKAVSKSKGCELDKRIKRITGTKAYAKLPLEMVGGISGSHYVGAADRTINYNLSSVVVLKGTEECLFPFEISIQLTPFSFLQNDIDRLNSRMGEAFNRATSLNSDLDWDEEDESWYESDDESSIGELTCELESIGEELDEMSRVFVHHGSPSSEQREYFRETPLDDIMDDIEERLSDIERAIENFEERLSEKSADTEDYNDEGMAGIDNELEAAA